MSDASKSQGSILSRLPAIPPRPGSRSRLPAVGKEDLIRRRMTQKLEATQPDPIATPAVEPRTAAVAALMVANFVAHDAVRKRFVPLAAAKLFDEQALDDLPVTARFVLRILPKLGPELHERDVDPPSELLAAARTKHGEMMRLAERHLSDIDEAHGRIVTIRLSQGHADLVHDLRMLADLWRDYGDTLEIDAGAAYRAEAGREARELALRLEIALLAPITEEEAEWRSYLQRALAMLVPLYDEVCRAGRFLFHSEKPEARFPTFASVARVRRRLSREVARKSEARAPASQPQGGGPTRYDSRSFPPPEVSLTDVNETRERVFAGALEAMPPSQREAQLPPVAAAAPSAVAPAPSVPPPAPSAPPPAPSAPRPAPSAPVLAAETLDFGSPPAAAEDADADLGTPEIDLDVTYASESNFFADVAMTNVGVFVATFVVKEPGTPITLRLSLPELESPIVVAGEVTWVREFSPSIEAPPGMGVSLGGLQPGHMRAIDAFMKVRAPILHDD